MIFGTVERRKIDGTNHIISHLISVIPLDCKSLEISLFLRLLVWVIFLVHYITTRGCRRCRPLFLQTVLRGVVPVQQNSRNSVTSECNLAIDIAN
ncbi:hypothetical protein RIR_jg40650.t1 [Rhizophagus irregularis DAOM 181602=DAOM 197198]|nr:hypothetical protein RIR_jg40650.t1 [Rhizophagus irregularis DAOM 181602=DAOM 197198]